MQKYHLKHKFLLQLLRWSGGNALNRADTNSIAFFAYDLKA
jgi:hypothetical protein